MKRRRALGAAALATLAVTALSIGVLAVAGVFGGHAFADQRSTTIPNRDLPTDETHSTYTFTGNWPSAADIQPWAKCVAVTYIETGKIGSDMTECEGAFDVNYWRNFTGGVHDISGMTPLGTAVTFKGQQNTKRNKYNCPNTLDKARYVKCLKVPGPSGGGSDGVVLSVGTYTGTDNTSSMRVDWDYGWSN